MFIAGPEVSFNGSPTVSPTTTPSMNGIGDTPSWLVPGCWVVGFFRDAQHLQEPIILGTLPGKPSQKNNKEKLSDENLIKEIVNNQSMEDLKLVSEDRNILRLTGLIEDKTSDEMKVLYAKLDSIGSEFPKDVKLEYTGTTLVALKTNDYLVQALVNSLGLALFFISLIMAYLFRANSILFISLITNLVPIFTILGLLAWLSISIRPPTAMTFAVALGIAVDDSLHFLLRYKKELSKGLSRLEAIQSTIINTGSALMITTTVLVAGFSVLLFSAFLPTYQFGLLAAAVCGTDGS